MKWTIEDAGWKWEYTDGVVGLDCSFQELHLLLQNMTFVFAEAILRERFRREFLKKTLEELKE